MNLNKVYLIGRLTQDPESRSTTTGQNVTTIRLATNRVWNDASTGRKESTEYHTVIAWGRLGEIANNYLKKGGLVMIEGRMQTRNWTGQDNVKRYVTEVIAEGLQMGPRAAGTGSTSSPQAMSDVRPQRREAAPASAPTTEPEIPIIGEDEPASGVGQGIVEDEMAIKESDLPF